MAELARLDGSLAGEDRMAALEGRAVPLHAGAAVGLHLAGPRRGGVLHLDLVRGKHVDHVRPLARDDVGGGRHGRRRYLEPVASGSETSHGSWVYLTHIVPETSLSWRV